MLISDIAREGRIPKKFLEIILLELRNQGFVNSRKGRGGGYYLTSQASEVNMADIMRLIDGPIALLPCATHRYYERCPECRDEETCGIRNVIQEVRDHTVKILKKSTLAEIMIREGKLHQRKTAGRRGMPRPGKKSSPRFGRA